VSLAAWVDQSVKGLLTSATESKVVQQLLPKALEMLATGRLKAIDTTKGG
jgi:hypothetical protein